jgi:hypothetical protein
LTTIDKNIATKLAKNNGNLSLDRLTTIDKEVATELAKHNGLFSLD